MLRATVGATIGAWPPAVKGTAGSVTDAALQLSQGPLGRHEDETMTLSTQRSRALRWLGVAGLVLIGIASYGLYRLTHGPFGDSAFDREIWHRFSGSMNQDNPRGPMADALTDLLLERRPTRNEVLELLGKTEYPCAAFDPPRGSASTCVSYNLGMWSGFRMDYDTLDIYFGPNGRVVDALIVQH